MKLAWGILTDDARGKIGSICATLTRSGPILRGHFGARRSATQTQLECRAALGSLSVLWSDPSMLTYRAGWVALGLANPEHNVFAADIYKTGLQMFTRANRNRQIIGEDVILEAPAYAAVGDPAAVTLTHGTGPESLEVSATNPPAPGDEAVLIYATPPLSPGIFTLGHQQRKLMIVNPGTAGPWDILAAYTAKFGTPATGRQVFVEVWYMDIAQGMIGLKSQAAELW